MSSTDAFEALRAETIPIDPDPAFARRVREHLATHRPTSKEPAVNEPDLHVVNTVTPYLVVAGAAAAIDYYIAAFGAVEHHRLVGDDGRVGHAELVVGNSRLMLADEYPEHGIVGPTTLGGSPVSFTILVPDVDVVFAKAIVLGGEVVRPVEDQFYGHRQGMMRDPWGHRWSVSTPIHVRYEAEAEAAGFEYRRGPAAGEQT